MHADRAGRPPAGGASGCERALKLPVGSDVSDPPEFSSIDVSASSVPSLWVEEYDDERAQRIDRLAADVDLHMRLALQGFTGPEYERFREELTRYGFDVMIGWLRRGKIFARMKEKGYGIPAAPDSLLDYDAQDGLADETVAKALLHFHHDVLLRRQWDPGRGARLTTFFVGQCLIQFANIYRSWHRQEMRYYDMVDDRDAAERGEIASDHTADPEWIAIARTQVRRGIRGIRDERLHEVLEMLVAGEKQVTIAEALGTTEKTIERMLANHRSRLKNLGIA